MNDDVRIIILRIVVGVVNHLFTTTTYQSPFFPPGFVFWDRVCQVIIVEITIMMNLLISYFLCIALKLMQRIDFFPLYLIVS
jgi:hypothetical protein